MKKLPKEPGIGTYSMGEHGQYLGVTASFGDAHTRAKSIAAKFYGLRAFLVPMSLYSVIKARTAAAILYWLDLLELRALFKEKGFLDGASPTAWVRTEVIKVDSPHYDDVLTFFSAEVLATYVGKTFYKVRSTATGVGFRLLALQRRAREPLSRAAACVPPPLLLRLWRPR